MDYDDAMRIGKNFAEQVLNDGDEVVMSCGVYDKDGRCFFVTGHQFSGKDQLIEFLRLFMLSRDDISHYVIVSEAWQWKLTIEDEANLTEMTYEEAGKYARKHGVKSEVVAVGCAGTDGFRKVAVYPLVRDDKGKFKELGEPVTAEGKEAGGSGLIELLPPADVPADVREAAKRVIRHTVKVQTDRCECGECDNGECDNKVQQEFGLNATTQFDEAKSWLNR